MKLLNRMTGLAVVIVIFAATIATAQEPTAGVVRISDQATAGRSDETSVVCRPGRTWMY